jgi:metallo-beta-lactamase class B
MKALSIALVLSLAGGVGVAPPTTATGLEPIKPYRVVGNIYYVGSEGLSAWLITSSEGHVLLDSGPSADGAKLIEGNIATLGFKLADVKILINSHAHFDHAGGTAQLKADTGAKVWASRLDEPALEKGQALRRQRQRPDALRGGEGRQDLWRRPEAEAGRDQSGRPHDARPYDRLHQPGPWR